MLAPVQKKTQRPILEPGSYVGICVAIIQLGEQETSFQGTKTFTQQLRVSFELPEEKAIFSQDKGEQPFLVGKDFTYSFGAKANLRKFVNGWRGKKLTDEEAETYDISKLLGKQALVNVGQYTKDGINYNSLEGLSPVPNAMKAERKPENPLILWDMSNPDWTQWDSIPEFLRKKISGSPEFKELQSGKPKESSGSGYDFSPSEDDMPF